MKTMPMARFGRLRHNDPRMTRPVDDKLGVAIPPVQTSDSVGSRLDRVRPTVVVRRRVYDVPAPGAGMPKVTHAGAMGVDGDEYGDDESGPPSSVNVARALSALPEGTKKSLGLPHNQQAPAHPRMKPAPLENVGQTRPTSSIIISPQLSVTTPCRRLIRFIR